ncbi:ankyrin repeat-containing domain protein [Hypoxylon sp. FL0543]|nr:ankyrin repeat-containing domain protein [Hypoxylon sp. FL0543]
MPRQVEAEAHDKDTGSIVEANQHTMSPSDSVTCYQKQKLPENVLYYIARNFLTDQRDRCHLRQTCHQLAGTLEGLIYRDEVLSDCGPAENYRLREYAPVPSYYKAELSSCVRRYTSYLERGLRSLRGYPPLHCAAAHGLLGMAKSIIKTALRLNPEYLDIQDADGRTALSLAAEKGHVEIIRELLDAGAFADPPSLFEGENLYTGRSEHVFIPINYAIYHGHEDAAMLLARHTEYARDARALHVYPPINLAVIKRMPNVVKGLLSRKIMDMGPGGNHAPLFLAAVSSDHNYEMIDMLLQNGAVVDSWMLHTTVMANAVRWGCNGNALHLLGRENPNNTGRWISRTLEDILNKDSALPVIKVLVERLNKHGHFKILHYALQASIPGGRQYRYCKPPTTKFLLRFMATRLNKDYLREGQTYLHWLLQQREVYECELDLFSCEARDEFDINATDAEGYTPLDYAISYRHKKAAQLLRSHGAVLGAWARNLRGSGSCHELPDHLRMMSLCSRKPPQKQRGPTT